MEYQETLIPLLYAAGLGQIFIALIYNWVREILEWEADIQRMKNRWNQQITNTYSRYIQGLNLAFGLITLLLAPAFFEGNAIAAAIALLIALYWLGRLAVAIGYYDTKAITTRRGLFKYGAWGFNLLFLYLAAVYGFLFAVTIA